MIFGIAMLMMIASWWLVDIPHHSEDKLSMRGSVREFRRTKYFGLKMFSGFLYGFSLRSALAVILLPFLIFQVVEKESSLNIIQTGLEVLALLATYYFAGHKKNTEYITKLLILGAGTTLFGLVALFVDLSIQTYIVFVVTYVIALGATSIAVATMSSNYVTTIRDHKKHRIEYIAVRELFAILGFISGYVFVYFKSDLTLSSLRPMLGVMIAATMVSFLICLKLWRHVQNKDNHTSI